ncbi:AAA domain containing protein [uncultured Caudovirales phage]|uniref:AAA domain containing protein n=1 Tax=uncultured Caudovirales phage TaxID=2100421 RepID=A0A6J5RYY3_9CAUD|nr:AAA domain containing protein [uncultured Caudovirales phage]CAB4181983.1 AAA domain containing protein [uncultured Caudovirales phage]CAB4197505.1 AAA domain containing protein [uncultured Caudovirales phage]CAB4211591.1 AAA domain containing protein [uncultured Caudovirales phage]CAB5238704.1 AAA domain containing protein [uncultured Caudovirales phage]
MMKMTQDLHKWIRDLAAGHNIVTRSFPALARSAKRKRKKQGKKLLRKYTWDAFDNQFDLSKIMDDKKIFLGVSDFEDLITVEIMKRRVDAKLSTVQRETTVLCDRQRWSKWAEEHYKECLFVQSNVSTGFIVEEDTNNFIKFDVNSNSTTVRAFGDVEYAEDMIEIVESNFDIVSSHIEWVYGADGNSVNVPLNRDRMPVEEMYPFLNGESLGDYYDRYMESSANILLLIGPPGTGKTTFIRGLLAHRNCSAIVTYDAGILEKDGFFAKFIEDDAEVMVLEDSDAFLKSRSDGNTMMHRFLNVGDGLVTTKGKKMIFSTNLPSVRDIDSALIRPGRCFDILTFDTLSHGDAKKLAKKLNVTLPDIKDAYSIAEVFNAQSENTKKSSTNRKVGFI